MAGLYMRAPRSRVAPARWIPLVFAFVICLPAPPAFADDNARANRLMVEAVGLVGAAEREPSAQERFRLLQRAHELLLDIVQRHPSTDLAVKLATGQRIGTVSLAGVREAMDRARDAVASAPPPPRQPGAPVQAWRHRKAVVAVGWSANGGRVTSVSRDGVAATRDVGTGATLHKWRHGGRVTAAAVSPDGRRVLAGAASQAAVLRDIRSGKVLHRWQAGYRVRSVAWSSSRRWVLAGDEGYEAELHEVETGRTLRKWRYDATVEALAFSPDERRVLMASATARSSCAICVCRGRSGVTSEPPSHPTAGAGRRGGAGSGLSTYWA